MGKLFDGSTSGVELELPSLFFSMSLRFARRLSRSALLPAQSIAFHPSLAVLSRRCSAMSGDAPRRVPRAVIFDMGGVIVPSPFSAIFQLERRLGLKENSINKTILAGGYTGAFARLERGELTIEDFQVEFAREFSEFNGQSFDVSKLMVAFGESMAEPLPYMIDAVQCIRAEGLRTALLTNNWKWAGGQTSIPPGVRELFDEVGDMIGQHL